MGAGPFEIFGVTTDNYVVYATGVATPGAPRDLNVVPTTGGAPAKIGALGVDELASVGGVFTDSAFGADWFQADQNGDRNLYAWTPAGGVHQITTAATYWQAPLSRDGKSIAYIEQTAADVGDLYIAGSDGTQKHSLASVRTDAACHPNLGIVGGSVVAVYCPAGSASDVPNLVTFAPPNWTPVMRGTGTTRGFNTNHGETHVWLPTPQGMVAYPVASGPGVVVDPAPVTQNGLPDDNGEIVYATTAGELRTATISPVATTTLTSNILLPFQVSPDRKWVFVARGFNGSTGYSDVLLASTVTPGAPVELLSTQSGNNPFDAFTEDSSHMLYLSYAPGADTADLYAVPTMGGAPVKLASGSLGSDYMLGGARVLFDANTVVVGDYVSGTVDIQVVDLATSTTPTTLLHGVDWQYATTAQKDLAYSVSEGTPAEKGIWILTAIP
jgi:hypothetical protein